MRERDAAVGTRVVAIGNVVGVDLRGQAGTIIELVGHTFNLLVEFDNAFDSGHDGGGNGRPGRCRYGWFKEFELEESNNDENEPSIEFSFDELMQM